MAARMRSTQTQTRLALSVGVERFHKRALLTSTGWSAHYFITLSSGYKAFFNNWWKNSRLKMEVDIYDTG